MNRLVGFVLGCSLITSAAGSAWAAGGPTEESALAAEQDVARALLANDANAVGRLLTEDWVVVSTYGGMADKDGFLEVIKSGQFTRKTMDLSDYRVRLYGNTAVVTSKLKTSGTLNGKELRRCRAPDGCVGLAGRRLEIRLDPRDRDPPEVIGLAA